MLQRSLILAVDLYGLGTSSLTLKEAYIRMHANRLLRWYLDPRGSKKRKPEESGTRRDVLFIRYNTGDQIKVDKMGL
jgi:hypothetical protein